MAKTHDYTARVIWTGNRGEGTKRYRGYDRTWDIATPGKPIVSCSNDPLLGGNPALPEPRGHPSRLALGVPHAVVLAPRFQRQDRRAFVRGRPHRTWRDASGRRGRFLEATLRPRIEVERGADLALAEGLHHEVHKYCFIARSVNFPIRYAPAFVEVDTNGA